MPRTTPTILDSGDAFPELAIDTVEHGRVALPEHWGDGYGVLLVYRAHW
jgi:hypothetical protein